MNKMLPKKLILIYSSVCSFLLAILIFLVSLVGFNNIAGFYGGAKKIDINEKGTPHPTYSFGESPTPLDLSPLPSEETQPPQTTVPATTAPVETTTNTPTLTLTPAPTPSETIPPSPSTEPPATETPSPTPSQSQSSSPSQATEPTTGPTQTPGDTDEPGGDTGEETAAPTT